MHQLQSLPIPCLSGGGSDHSALRHAPPHEKTFAKRCETHYEKCCEVHCARYFEAHCERCCEVRYETQLES